MDAFSHLYLLLTFYTTVSALKAHLFHLLWVSGYISIEGMNLV